MTEGGQRMCRSHQLSAESIAKDMQTLCGLRLAKQLCSKSFMEWVSMAKQLHP
ncbi:unnamed protein product, partial [Staurois parvus]